MTGASSTDPLEVLVLNKRSWTHPRAGGSECNLRETLSRLAEDGHDVTLLTGAYPEPARRSTSAGVTIRRLGPPGRLPAPWDVVVSYVFATVYFHIAVWRWRPDIVYTVNTPLPWLIYTRRPRVAIFHHVAIDSFFETHPFPQNLLGYVAQVVGVWRERSTPTVSVSTSTTEALLDRGHTASTVVEIRNGIDTEWYTPGTAAPEPRITYLGGLERYKGVDRLPSIHRAVQRRMDVDVHLDVAGRSGPLEEDIASYCAGTPTASFHGFVSQERKRELLRRAWVFVAPSRVEGWGIAVLEANACGTPAVGADVPGIRDAIRDGQTGRLVDGTDPAAFGEAVVSLLDDESGRTDHARTARAWAERHTWDAAAEQLATVFERVVAGQSIDATSA